MERSASQRHSTMKREQNVKVAIRIRPLLEDDQTKPQNQNLVVEDDGVGSLLKFHKTNKSIEIKNKFSNYEFQFDHLYIPKDGQHDVFDCVEPLLAKFVEGYNVTVMAYGQTSSGKTYTIGTDAKMNEQVETQEILNLNKDAQFTCSFVEIYNDDLIDLLLEVSILTMGPNYISQIQIREDTTGKISLSGLQQKPLNNIEDVFDCLKLGTSRRQTAQTQMNKSSSRSHAIFTIHQSYTEKTNGANSTIIKSKFHFVDLAGSERLKKTQATGDRVKEGITINGGLLALGNVINALTLHPSKRGYIPYRDSKLTRVLQDSVGGNSISLMIACISPTPFDNDESINTLKYASRARSICSKVTVNKTELVDLDMLKKLVLKQQDEISKLKAQNIEPHEKEGKEDESLVLESLELVWLRNSALENDIKLIKDTYYKIQKKYSLLVQAYLNMKSQTKLLDDGHSLSPSTENSFVNDMFDPAIDHLESDNMQSTLTKNDQELRDKIEEMSLVIEKQQQQIIELRVTNTNTDIDDLEKEVDELSFSFSHLESKTKIQDLESQVKQKNSLINQLTRKLKEVSPRSKVSLVDENEDSGVDNNPFAKESLDDEISINNVLNPEMEQLQISIKSKETELESLKSEYFSFKQSYEAEYHQLQAKYDRLKSDIKNNQVLITEFENIIEEYEEKHSQNEAKIGNHEKESLILKEKFEKEKLHLIEEIMDIKDQFNALNTQFQLKNLELEETKLKLRKKEDEFMVLNERFVILAEEEQLRNKSKKGKFLCF